MQHKINNQIKKQTLLVLAGGLLTFAACTNEAKDGEYTQEQVDSIVDARVMEMQTQMQMSNDSAINALAQWKADSMIAAAKGQAPSTPKPKVKGTSGGGGGSTTTTNPSTPTTPAEPGPTGKNSESQKTGEATGKNSEAQKEGAPTGKRR